MSTEKIKREAERLLEAGRVFRAPVPVTALAKLAGATLRVGPLPEELSGFLLFQDKKAILGVNSTHSRTRQRFTVAHEIGHLILHPDRDHIDRKFPVYFRNEQSSKAEVTAEIEANQFAAELLMPRRIFIPVLGRLSIDIEDQSLIAGLAKKFDVSPQALTFRLINLGYVSQPSAPAVQKRKTIRR